MHIHVPDGVFPPWIWIGSIIILAPLLALALFLVRKKQEKLVITSALTALMLVVFSIEVLGFHLNFTALSGILLGPWWSLISITVVNAFLSLFGHGGITVSPINILINWAEALIGFLFFRIIAGRIKSKGIKSSIAGVVVIIALSASFVMFVGIVALTGINPAKALESPGSLVQAASGNTGYVPLKEFVAISILPTIIGAIIEAVLTALIINFILKTKPGMIEK